MHTVTRPPAPWLACDGALRVHVVPAARDNLIWLAECTTTHEVAVIDGPGADDALAYVEAQRLRWTAVFNTHTHGDHIGINVALMRAGRLEGLAVVGPAARAADIPGLTQPVAEGDAVRIGAVEGRVMVTEGHLDGHVSFVFGDVVFCGDTLFTGGCGRMFDGPPAKMYDSLQRLAALPGPTRVCCAHEYTQDNLRFAWSLEPDNEALAARIRDVWAVRAHGGTVVPSTIEIERATNPFLRPGSPTLRASLAAAAPDADLSTPERTFAATRRLKDAGVYRSRGDEGLPLS